MLDTDVTMGPPLATTCEPSQEIDDYELVFTPGAWCCPISNVPPGVTNVQKPRISAPVDCDSDDDEEPPTIFCRRGDMSSSDDGYDYDEEEGSFADEQFVNNQERETQGSDTIPPPGGSLTSRQSY
jgi:hypothetical protein